jgi:hypothetical protein
VCVCMCVCVRVRAINTIKLVFIPGQGFEYVIYFYKTWRNSYHNDKNLSAVVSNFLLSITP